MVVDFTKDGKTVVKVHDVSISGTYQIKQDGKVEVALSLKDKTSKGTYEMRASPDTLELKDSYGKVDKFKRVK